MFETAKRSIHTFVTKNPPLFARSAFIAQSIAMADLCSITTN